MIFSDGDLTMSGNDIYRQVCVSFYLDSVIVTNIPAAYNLLYDTTTNGVWDFDRLVGVGHDTSGIECYFVNRFIRTNGKRSPVAANTDHGLVLTAKAGVTTLAHEIGHVFGLKDVYVTLLAPTPATSIATSNGTGRTFAKSQYIRAPIAVISNGSTSRSTWSRSLDGRVDAWWFCGNLPGR